MIKLDHAAESLAADDLTIRLANVISGFNERIIERLAKYALIQAVCVKHIRLSHRSKARKNRDFSKMCC